MGYQESLVYIQPQSKFRKLMQAYEKAELSGYYHVAGAAPRTVIVLRRQIGELPAGTKLLWVCGDRCFHNVTGIFGGKLQTGGKIQIIPADTLFAPDDEQLKGIDFESPVPSENAFMKRYSAENFAFRMRMGFER